MSVAVSVNEDKPGTAISTAVEQPNWMTPEEIQQSQDKSFAQSAAPPVILVVQGNAKREIAESYDQGSVIAMPLGQQIAAKGQPFDFVPLTSWSMYTGWTPRKRAQGVPPFIGVSRDPYSIEARKSRSFHKEFNSEYSCDVNWRETICFLVYVLNSEVKIPCIMMFGSTGFKSGQALASMVISRQAQVPAFAQIYSAESVLKSNEQGTWYTLTVSPPQSRSAVVQDADLGRQLMGLASEMRERMQVEYASHLKETADMSGEGNDTEAF